jgi:K+-sensing histidine kinase KdpD
MSSKDIRWIHPYLLAILAVFLACQAIWFIQPYISISPAFITFLGAIMFTAWYGGFRPAMLATVLSTVIVDYYFIVPLHSFFPLSLADFGALAFFGVSPRRWRTLSIIFSVLDMTRSHSKSNLSICTISVGDS